MKKTLLAIAIAATSFGSLAQEVPANGQELLDWVESTATVEQKVGLVNKWSSEGGMESLFGAAGGTINIVNEGTEESPVYVVRWENPNGDNGKVNLTNPDGNDRIQKKLFKEMVEKYGSENHAPLPVRPNLPKEELVEGIKGRQDKGGLGGDADGDLAKAKRQAAVGIMNEVATLTGSDATFEIVDGVLTVTHDGETIDVTDTAIEKAKGKIVDEANKRQIGLDPEPMPTIPVSRDKIKDVAIDYLTTNDLLDSDNLTKVAQLRMNNENKVEFTGSQKLEAVNKLTNKNFAIHYDLDGNAFMVDGNGNQYTPEQVKKMALDARKQVKAEAQDRFEVLAKEHAADNGVSIDTRAAIEEHIRDNGMSDDAIADIKSHIETKGMDNANVVKIRQERVYQGTAFKFINEDGALAEGVDAQRVVDSLNEHSEHIIELTPATADGKATLTIDRKDGNGPVEVTQEDIAAAKVAIKDNAESKMPVAEPIDENAPIADLPEVGAGLTIQQKAYVAKQYVEAQAATAHDDLQDARIDFNEQAIANLQGEIKRLDEQMDGVMAGTHAVNNARPYLSGEGATAIGVGTGFAGSSSAVAIGAAHAFTDGLSASMTLNVTTGSYSEVSGGAGVQYQW